MHSEKLSFIAIVAIGVIYLCTAVGWAILGGALTLRTRERAYQLTHEVISTWGGALQQQHPQAWYASPAGVDGRSNVHPAESRIFLDLNYAPKRKGLLWYRTYEVHFKGDYIWQNPTPIEQTLHVTFQLPSASASYEAFTFELGDQELTEPVLRDGLITQAIVLPALTSVELRVAYKTRGLDNWHYDLRDVERIKGFKLSMQTDFADIDFPLNTGSPTDRVELSPTGWQLLWDYPDVIGAKSIGMDMPKVLNPGPIASRMSYFAPVSLLFFFAVLVIVGAVRRINLHPVNYFFLAAGCFAFQLLFAYTVDIMPIHVCFMLAASVSVLLVCGYLHTVGGWALTKIAFPAQFAYMVLFSYSFFFDGLSGLTIAVGAVMTLAILMKMTAKVNWYALMSRRHRGESSHAEG